MAHRRMDGLDNASSERVSEVISRLDVAVASSSKILYYPLVVKEAHECTVTDIEGRDYLDFNAGWTVAGVGYSNPEVVAAVRDEVGRSMGLTAATFPSAKTVDFAERLISLAPGSFSKKVWFGHSGTDACAAAYKLLPVARNKQKILSFYGGMHGIDLAGIAMGGIPAVTRYDVPSVVTKIPYAYCYRCPYGLEYPSCNIYCAGGFIEEQALKYVCPPDDVAFMIVEAMQSDAGDIVPPDEYLPRLKKTAETNGFPIVADEVKIGLARTGRMFGVDHTEVQPDAIALGKSLASGLPLGALIAKDDLLPDRFALSTLVGNPVVAAAGLATIRVIEREKLATRAARTGALLKRRMEELKSRHRLIGDVRGRGLFVGLELVKDQRTKEPARLETAKVVFRAWQLGLLTVFVGADANVIELTPPLVITEAEIEKGTELLDKAITDVERGDVPDSAVERYTGM